MKVFLAAPIFSTAERKFNSKLAEELRKRGYEVFLAQELPLLSSESEEDKKKIFSMDIKGLEGSDVVVAVLDGIDVDSGVAFELGYAFARGKPIIGVKTDHRCFSPYEEVNLMIEVPATIIRGNNVRELAEKIDSTVKRLNSGQPNP